LIDEFTKQGELATAANELRYQQGLGIYGGIADAYAPGGQFGRGAMQQYEAQKKRSLAQQQQQLVSSGLANTTIMAGLGRGYEETVGTPFRLQLADLQMQRYAEAMGQKAGFIERREDVPPSPELMANLVTQAEAGPDGPQYGDSPAGTAGVSDTTGTGAAGYGVTGTGATGTILPKEFKQETQRIKRYAQAQKDIAKLPKQIEAAKAELANTPEEKTAKRERIQRKISTLEGKLADANTSLSTHDPKNAVLTPEQYRNEQVRRFEATKAAKEAERASLAASERVNRPGLLTKVAAVPGTTSLDVNWNAPR
jgi:hypothetical protein